jgi:hypothetical protein
MGLSAGALYNHNKKHISKLYRANIEAGLFGSYDELKRKALEGDHETLDVTRVAISAHLGKFLNAAQTNSANQMAVHGAQLRQWSEFQSRITRELAPAGNTTNNFLMTDITGLLRILRNYPEACKAVVAWYDDRLPGQQRIGSANVIEHGD